MRKLYNLIILLFLIPSLGFSNGDKFAHTKQKNIKITYLVNPDVSLSITNSYGSITIMTWDEDKIDLDVTIKASSNNENWVNQRLSDINIDINALKSIVSATTIIESSKNKNGSNNNFEINYILKIPKNSTNVNLINKYGSIIIADLSLNTSTNINCKYGKLILGKLNGTNNTIQMDYCNNSNINYFNGGSITAKYSDLNIEQLNQLELTSDYTNLFVQEAKQIKYNSKYSKIIIQNIKVLDGLGNYLKIKIGNLNDNLKINTKYSDIAINNVTAIAHDVAILSNYSNVSLIYDENYTFDFDIAVRYANFKYENDLSFTNREETINSKKYNGYYKKKGSNTIKIASDYGNVSLIKK